MRTVTEARYPGVRSSSGKAAPWAGLDNVKYPPDAAVAYVDGDGASDTLVLKNFGFQLPAATAMTAYRALMRCRKTGGAGVVDTKFAAISGMMGLEVGDDQADAVTQWPAGDLADRVYDGGVDPTWGMSLSPANVRDGDFGLKIGETKSGGGQAQVDAVRLEATFEAPNAWFGGFWRGDAEKCWF